jgi:hypothetical protein
LSLSLSTGANQVSETTKQKKNLGYWFKQYGMLGLGTYSAIYLLGVPAFYVGLVTFGVDIMPVLDYLTSWGKLLICSSHYKGIDTSFARSKPDYGVWAVALLLNELSEPIRLPLALFTTVQLRRLFKGGEE